MLGFEPFVRNFDRVAQQLWGSADGTTTRPAVMPIDVWRDEDTFVVELDLPGVNPDTIDVSVDQGALTVRAERPFVSEERHDWAAVERPHGVFTRQLLLGNQLDTDHIGAAYTDGVLRLTVPVAKAAKPRKIAVATGAQQAISA